jgi:hypothetical protein
MANRDNVFMLDIDAAEGGGLHVITPASVFMIHDAQELEERLEAFSDPIKNKVVQNTPKTRRWYVEKILPALRFYCDRLGVEQPAWLATNGHWERMTDEEKALLFGPGPLKLREFAPVNCPDIAVVRDEAEEGAQQ